MDQSVYSPTEMFLKTFKRFHLWVVRKADPEEQSQHDALVVQAEASTDLAGCLLNFS